MFSVGVLYSAQEFLEFVSKIPDLDLAFPTVMGSFGVASPTAMLELSQKCEWVQLTIEGKLIVSGRGRDVLLVRQPEQALRLQIGHLIETYLPPWLPLLSRGRSEAQKYLPADALQCFTEAGLFYDTSDEVVKWWDKYSKVSRKVGKDNKLETGRLGEKLSIQYERARTAREPVWQGFESNLSGFDVLSTVDKDDRRPLRIEVKTSNSRPEVATFYFTRNEWNVATTSENYLIHLWSLQPRPKLFIVEPSTLQAHIPFDRGTGEWQNAAIAYTAFIS